MSERKTAEIKFRITPSEKARWQALADVEEIGLSELIRRAVNAAPRTTAEERVWEKLNESLDGTALIDNAIAGLEETPEGAPEPGWVEDLISTNVTETGPPLTKEALLRAHNLVAAPQADVIEKEILVEVNEPKSWMFEGRNG